MIMNTLEFAGVSVHR